MTAKLHSICVRVGVVCITTCLVLLNHVHIATASSVSFLFRQLFYQMWLATDHAPPLHRVNHRQKPVKIVNTRAIPAQKHQTCCRINDEETVKHCLKMCLPTQCCSNSTFMMDETTLKKLNDNIVGNGGIRIVDCLFN